MNLVTPKEDSLIIRVTSREDFRKCPQLYYYKHVKQIEKRGKESGPLEFGTCGHLLLSNYYQQLKDGNSHEQALDNLWSEFDYVVKNLPREGDNNQKLLYTILKNYFNFYGNENIKPLFIEQRFYALIPGFDNVYLSGQMDLVTEDGLVDDNKFYNPQSLLTQKEAEKSDQLTAYLWLLRENGVDNVQKARYNQCLKKDYWIPELTKNGLSKNKAKCNRTTKAIYRARVSELGLNIEDYEDFIASIEDEELFRRCEITRSSTYLDNYGKILGLQIKRILDSKPYPEVQTYCCYCEFDLLCRTMLEGEDVNYQIRLGYKKKEQ